jgi:hypothetical protein
VVLCQENGHVKQREIAELMQLFFSRQRNMQQTPSVPSRQSLDETEQISLSFLPSLFVFFIFGFLIILFNVFVPRMKKFVL